MDVEPLGLAIGETIGDGLESLAHGIEMMEPFLQAEIAQIVGTQFVAQESGELLILFEEGVFPIGAEGRYAFARGALTFVNERTPDSWFYPRSFSAGSSERGQM